MAPTDRATASWVEAIRARQRPAQRKGKGGRAKAPVPEPLAKKQDEQRTLLRWAKEEHTRKLRRAAKDTPALLAYLETLDAYRKEVVAIKPGILDVDVAGLIVELGLHLAPEETRRLALRETVSWVMKVCKHNETLPWMLSRGEQLTIDTVKKVLYLR